MHPNNLPWPNDCHLLEAENRLKDGDIAGAIQALSKIDPEVMSEPEVVAKLWETAVAANNWPACKDVASLCLARSGEKDPLGWNLYAIAIRNLGELQEAYRTLTTTSKIFPRDPSTFYNLACFATSMGDPKTGLAHFSHAIQYSSNPRDTLNRALKDKDLEPLHPQLKSFQ